MWDYELWFTGTVWITVFDNPMGILTESSQKTLNHCPAAAWAVTMYSHIHWDLNDHQLETLALSQDLPKVSKCLSLDLMELVVLPSCYGFSIESYADSILGYELFCSYELQIQLFRNFHPNAEMRLAKVSEWWLVRSQHIWLCTVIKNLLKVVES